MGAVKVGDSGSACHLGSSHETLLTPLHRKLQEWRSPETEERRTLEKRALGGTRGGREGIGKGGKSRENRVTAENFTVDVGAGNAAAKRLKDSFETNFTCGLSPRPMMCTPLDKARCLGSDTRVTEAGECGKRLRLRLSCRCRPGPSRDLGEC